MKRVVKTMGELDSDGIKLKEDKDTEEMVDECGGVEVDGGKERLLPLLDVEEDSVEVEHGDGALDSGEEEGGDGEEEEGGLRLVDQGDVEDDQVKVVADHHHLLQQDDPKGIYVDNITIREHGGDSGKDGSEEENEGDNELGHPDVPDEENVPELCLLLAEVGVGDVEDGGADGGELENEIQPHRRVLLLFALCKVLRF